MTEYIDRQAAIGLLSEPITMSMCLSTDECHHKIAQRRIDRYLIENIHAADVRPVKRGKWVKNIRGDYCLVCSECGYGFPTDGFAWLDCNRRNDERETACHINDIMDFCPNCGADMREES